MREPTSEAWAQIRYDYEHTERPIEEICAEHRISSGTLRDRRRRWGWTPRRLPIPREGPPPLPAPAPPVFERASLPLSAAAFEAAAPSLPAAWPVAACAEIGAPSEETGAPDASDLAAIGPRLQEAVARVIPAIAATAATLGATPTHPRDMERAARALAALTRTLRELNKLLREGHAPAAEDDDLPADINAFRLELARKIDAFVHSHAGVADEASSFCEENGCPGHAQPS